MKKSKALCSRRQLPSETLREKARNGKAYMKKELQAEKKPKSLAFSRRSLVTRNRTSERKT